MTNMAKTQEELNAIKEEVETMDKKLDELTEKDIEDVNGAGMLAINMYRCHKCGKCFFQRGVTSYAICECGGSAYRVSTKV